MLPHLLSARDLSREQAVRILQTADQLATQQTQQPRQKLIALQNRTIVNLFYEDSTRTRNSFETAAKRLSAEVVNFTAKGSSVSKGESLKDTAQTLTAMGVDAVVVRHSASGAPHRLAHAGWISAPIINAGDGTNEHPTQALLDALTMWQHLRHSGDATDAAQTLAGKQIRIVGDVLHSRVARSNVWLLQTLGAQVTLVAPPTLLPVGVETWPCEVSYDLDAALTDADVVMTLRVQLERMNSGFFPSPAEYHRRYGMNAVRLARLPEHALIMHPGPMNRGVEIAAEVADSPQSVIVDQVANGVPVRMAVLAQVVGGTDADAATEGVSQ